jgi:LPPG:FO 2-phospho-L-lactate transferase
MNHSREQNQPLLRVAALAGGVGGAKLADGLARALPPEALTIIVNTGDDFQHLGLHISPDLDTVCYTLAGLANPVTGWGLADETWNALEQIRRLGGPDWFRLGDRDLGLHLERTRRLAAGESLSAITRSFCQAWGVEQQVLPASDHPIPTIVITPEGELAFQEYFVHQQCQPRVTGFRFEGVDQAAPAPGVLEAVRSAQAVIFCPSNPWVSLDPILALPGMRAALEETSAPIIAVSPLIGGQALKGPAAKMYRELGIEPQALAVARHYQHVLDGFVLDEVDAGQASAVEDLSLCTLTTGTVMKTPADRLHLAQQVLAFAARLSDQTGCKDERVIN